MNAINMKNSENHFQLTNEGYKQAREWLIENKLFHLIELEQSTDGFTVVSLANKLYHDIVIKKK